LIKNAEHNDFNALGKYDNKAQIKQSLNAAPITDKQLQPDKF